MKYLFQEVHLSLKFMETGRDSGPPTWGFYVYRATSSNKDEQLWEDFLDYLKRSALQFLVDNCQSVDKPAESSTTEHPAPTATDADDEDTSGVIDNVASAISSLSIGDTATSTAPRTVVGADAHGKDITPEDSRLMSTLDFRIWDDIVPGRLSIDEARSAFARWARGIRDANRQQYLINWSRYRYFLYVNDDVLRRYESARQAGKAQCEIDDDTVAILVEAHLSRWEDRDSDDEEGEDDPELAMGWQFVRPWALPAMYDGLNYGNSGWYDMFVTPPAVREDFYV
ncbi:hypothetical protein ACHAQH_004580 [Verticillium albo-atrum]